MPIDFEKIKDFIMIYQDFFLFFFFGTSMLKSSLKYGSAVIIYTPSHSFRMTSFFLLWSIKKCWLSTLFKKKIHRRNKCIHDWNYMWVHDDNNFG